jgi:hypothetical protein
MHIIRFLPGFIIAFALIILLPARMASADEAGDQGGTAIFQEKYSLESDALDDMRGGFVVSNGMVIDFSFSSNTLVDGQLINQLVLNSTESIQHSLQNIIQIGEGHSAFKGAAMKDLPQVLNIVQNNLDDLTIQQVNLFDLEVGGMQAYRRDAIGPEMDFQNSMAFAP